MFSQVEGEFGGKNIEAEAKYRDDLGGYGRDCLKIRTRDLRLINWELNTIQTVLDAVAAKQMEEIGRVRVIVPKRRRGGVSTYVQGRFYHKCSLNPLMQAFTVAHEAPSTRKIFNISKLMQEENPLCPPTKYSTRIELDFVNRSNLSLATAGSPEAARSSDITLFHWSEVAFCADAERLMTGIMACLPDPPAYSEAWFESSGNGFGNLFQRHCFETYAEGSHPYYEHEGYTYAYRDPLTDWVLVFFPWFCLPDAARDFDSPVHRADFERVLNVPVYRKDLGRSGDHEDLEDQRRYDLTLEQLNWRRWKIGSEYRGDVEKFTQEYPTTLNDCFRTTGGHVFSSDLCDELEKGCKSPIVDATLVERTGKVVPRRMGGGPLRIWEGVEKEEMYLVTCDPAGGERPHQSDKDDPDWTVMDVWKRDGKHITQVAQWRGRPDYDLIGEEAILLARYYNKAPIAVLRQNHGFAVLAILSKEEWGGIVKDLDGQPGIAEKVDTKRNMVDLTVRECRDGFVILRSVETVNEMRTFVEKAKKMGAEDGCKDDRVSSLYCGVHAHDILPWVGGSRKGKKRGQKGVRVVNATRIGKKKDVGKEETLIRV